MTPSLEEAHRFLDLAKADFEAFQVLAASTRVRPAIALFHAQQTAEKGLKCRSHRRRRSQREATATGRYWNSCKTAPTPFLKPLNSHVVRVRRLGSREMRLTDNEPVPAMRLAWSLDAVAETSHDSILARFEWAATVVRAELRDRAVVPHLRKEIDEFPTEFLLFLPVAVALDLTCDATTKKLRRKPAGLGVLLCAGDPVTRWRVVEREAHITDLPAKSDANHLHARETVPLAWAIPLDARHAEAGHSVSLRESSPRQLLHRDEQGPGDEGAKPHRLRFEPIR